MVFSGESISDGFYNIVYRMKGFGVAFAVAIASYLYVASYLLSVGIPQRNIIKVRIAPFTLHTGNNV